MEDFFIILHDILAEMEEVTDLQPVPDAHVPVMRFKFLGISIDLLYASISLLVVPEVSFCLKFDFIYFVFSEFIVVILFPIKLKLYTVHRISFCNITVIDHTRFQTTVCSTLLLCLCLISLNGEYFRN